MSALKQSAHLGALLQVNRSEVEGYTHIKRFARFLTLTFFMVLTFLAGASAAPVPHTPSPNHGNPLLASMFPAFP